MSDANNSPKTGYKQPPEHTQFKKGTSGNPRGRPKKQLSGMQMSASEQAFHASMTIKKNGREQKVSGFELMLRGIRNSAINGNISCARLLLNLRRKLLKAVIKEKMLITPPGRLGMISPPKLSLEAWQAMAVPSQALLFEQTQENV